MLEAKLGLTKDQDEAIAQLNAFMDRLGVAA